MYHQVNKHQLKYVENLEVFLINQIAINDNTLSIFDTCYGGVDNKQWSRDEYSKFPNAITRWTNKSKKWNAMLLLLPSNEVDIISRHHLK